MIVYYGVKPLAAQRREEIFLQVGEVFRRHGDIGLAPPHRVLGLGVADDELVLGRAAGVLAGGNDQRAIGGQATLAVADGVFDQRGSAEIGEHGRLGVDALTIKSVAKRRRGQRHLPCVRYRSPDRGRRIAIGLQESQRA